MGLCHDASMTSSRSRFTAMIFLALLLLPKGASSEEPKPEAARPSVAPPAPTAADLQLPAASFPGIAEVTTRALSVDDGSSPEGAVPPDILVLRRSGLASAAQYRYRLAGEPPGQLKVRVDVFRDEATAVAQFRGRHLPQALEMTKRLDAGDDGFIFQDQYAGFRVGPVVVEIRADGAGGRLADFARTYAGHVAARLRGTP